jgi:exocyst complex component 5
LRRDLQAVIGTRANINIAQIENYGGETFLSEEMAITILQESKYAFVRCQLVSKAHFKLEWCPYSDAFLQLSQSKECATNAAQILEILLQYLVVEHIDYAVDLGLQAVPIPESKNKPQIYFFDVVRQCNAIIHLLEKQFNDSIVPLTL